jgi:hypothetical protein
MSWVFQLLVRKVEDATSSAANSRAETPQYEGMTRNLQANCRESAAKAAHCHFSEKLA